MRMVSSPHAVWIDVRIGPHRAGAVFFTASVSEGTFWPRVRDRTLAVRKHALSERHWVSSPSPPPSPAAYLGRQFCQNVKVSAGGIPTAHALLAGTRTSPPW